MQQLEGQWFGNYAGTNSGLAILNLDRRPDGFSGSGVVLEGNTSLPSAVYTVTLAPSGRASSKGQAQLVRHFRAQKGQTKWIQGEEVAREFPGLLKAATKIELKGELKNGFLSLEFMTDAGTYGRANLERWPGNAARAAGLAGVPTGKQAAAASREAVAVSVLAKTYPDVVS